MIRVSVSESGLNVRFTAYEDEREIGYLSAFKENTTLFIEEIFVYGAESEKNSGILNAQTTELLIKSCVNYSINRDVLDLVLNCDYDSKILISLGFKKNKDRLSYYVPSCLGNCSSKNNCDN